MTTSEPKYAVSPYLAEFYCTLTSPLFALPVMIYALDWDDLPVMGWLFHASVFASVLVATASTLYHATLYRLWSTLDTCLAAVMLWVVGGFPVIPRFCSN